MKAIDELEYSNMKLFEIWKENIFKIPDVTKDMQEIVKVKTCSLSNEKKSL